MAGEHIIISLSLSLACVSLHFYTLFLISRLRAQQAPYTSQTYIAQLSPLRRNIRWLGSANALLMLALPYAVVLEDPMQGGGLRVICFFYACKTLDLAVAKVETPPTRLSKGTDTTPAAMETVQDKMKYTLALATEMRYHSFDIAIKQKRPIPDNRSLIWNITPALIIPALALLFPVAELKCATLLLAFQCTFEALHCLLHPKCTHWLCSYTDHYNPI